MRRPNQRARQKMYALAGVDAMRPQFVGPNTFIGGRNVDWAEDMASGKKEGGVLPSQCIILENFDIDSQGILTGRKGTTKMNSTAVNSGAQIHSIYRYRQASTTTNYFIVQCGTKVYTMVLATGAVTEIATGLAQVPLKWVTWNDKAYGANGTGIYKYCPTDGTPWQQVQSIDAQTPDANDITVFQDVMFAAQNGTSFPSRVFWSDEFDGEAWDDTTNFRRVRERDGQEIMSLEALGGRVLCLKDKSAWFLYGSSIYSFAEELISDEIGQIGRMASAGHEGKKFFQSNRGIEYFDPSTPKQFNNIARGTCQKEIMAYSRSVRNNAVMCYWPLYNRLLVSYPGATIPTVYVFFLNHPQMEEDGNIWFPHTIYTGITVTAMCVTSASGDAQELYWATDGGFVYKYDQNYQDAGVNITGSMKWGFTDCMSPTLVKNFSRCYVPARITGTMNITLDVDFSATTQQKTTTTYLPTGTGVFGTGVFGTAVFGGAYVLNRSVRYTRMNGIKAAILIQVSYGDRVEIHPFCLEYYPKERVRFP